MSIIHKEKNIPDNALYFIIGEDTMVLYFSCLYVVEQTHKSLIISFINGMPKPRKRHPISNNRQCKGTHKNEFSKPFCSFFVDFFVYLCT